MATANASKKTGAATLQVAAGQAKDGQAEGMSRVVTDEAGRIVFASAAFAALTETPAERLKGLPLTSVLSFAHPEEALGEIIISDGQNAAASWPVNQGIHRGTAFGQPVILQFDRVATPDGRFYMVGADVNGGVDSADYRGVDPHLARALGGARPGMHSAASDGAAATDGDLREFLDMSNDLLAVSSHDGVFLRVNGLLIEVLGYAEVELRRMSFLDLIHPEDRTQVRYGLSRLMRDDDGEGRTIDFEARAISKGGEMLHTTWRQKRKGNMLYSVGRDVTAIKRHEIALRSHERQLQEAETLGHIGHWRWVVGADDIEWSDELYRIFGQERGAFQPSLDAINAVLHKRDVGRLLQAFQRAIIERANYEMDCRIQRPDGEERIVRCEGKCEEDANGEVVALFGVMQDITMRVMYENDLLAAKESAERAYEAKSQFLANMSHELRTPLNAIIGFSEMMQRQLLGPIGTPRYLDYINGIRESGEHLLDLIADILDMSKIEAGKYDLDCEEFNAAKLINLAIHMMEGRAQDGCIKLACAIEGDDIAIIADRRAIMQVMLNLLSNAVKFTEPGGTVSVACRAEGAGHLSITVADTGIGIPADKIAQITRPFEQAGNHYTRDAKRGGTGLGLAITKDLTELHGGQLDIQSTQGVGTTVTLRLPRDARPLQKQQPVQTTMADIH